MGELLKTADFISVLLCAAHDNDGIPIPIPFELWPADGSFQAKSNRAGTGGAKVRSAEETPVTRP
jgi:hypothetical protein